LTKPQSCHTCSGHKIIFEQSDAGIRAVGVEFASTEKGIPYAAHARLESRPVSSVQMALPYSRGRNTQILWKTAPRARMDLILKSSPCLWHTRSYRNCPSRSPHIRHACCALKGHKLWFKCSNPRDSPIMDPKSPSCHRMKVIQ